VSKNVTRNVRIVGLEVRDLCPDTAVHTAGTHPQPRRSSCSPSCFSGPLLHNALTSWCLYVTSFEGLFVFSFVEIYVKMIVSCMRPCLKTFDVSVCHVTCRNFSLFAEKVSAAMLLQHCC